jgi:hypothetical protein
VKEASDVIDKLLNGIDPRGEKKENGGRLEMTNGDRAEFWARSAHLGRWKAWNQHMRSYIEEQGWGDALKEDTTRWLTKEQQQNVLVFIASMPSPTWEELFGPEDGPWKNVVAWASAPSVGFSPWDTAIYISDNLAPAEDSGHRPIDYGRELAEKVERMIVKTGETLIDEIKDYAEELRPGYTIV